MLEETGVLGGEQRAPDVLGQALQGDGISRRPTRGERLGLLELQTLWPFPYEMIKRKCKHARSVAVVELNAGQIVRTVKNAVDDPEKVFLANRVDGVFITPMDIRNILRFVQGRGA